MGRGELPEMETWVWKVRGHYCRRVIQPLLIAPVQFRSSSDQLGGLHT